MNAIHSSIIVLAATTFGVLVTGTSPVEARCYTFQASHNGTDIFNPVGGAKTAATIKLNTSIELWQQKKGIKKVRIGKVTIKCDPWSIKFILPHHRCYAQAQVCY